MNLLLARLPSPIGFLAIATRDGVLCALEFEDCAERLQRSLRLHYGAVTLTPGPAPVAIADRLAAYFAGNFPALDDIAVRTGGTGFQRALWETLRTIPPGTTTTYARLAATIGRPAAIRAAGAANGANPIAIVVPCHRVIGTDGRLTGYGGGIDRKAWLLRHEGA